MHTDASSSIDVPGVALDLPRSGAAIRRPVQNWILNPLQDSFFVIATPLLVMAAALALFRALGAAAATSLIIVAHIVFTVAHHLPTFIRIYGDVELFRRHRWHFIMGPVVPLAFSAAVLGYINHHGYPVESFLYLYIMLVLWDPWHFLRQHYGFVRIYDRPNEAPKPLAARMDLWLCTAWFVYILLGSSAWLAGILADLHQTVRIPLIRYVAADIGALATRVARDLTVLMTMAYALYLMWCRFNGYFISLAKLTLLVATFGAMYFAYVPSEWMQSVAPGWTFKAGFAVIGIVHMTQYLAIVWRYNRTLAQSPERARAGWFRAVFRRGGWAIGIGYVLLCLGYGELITTEQSSRWVMSVLLAVGFTSTLLHYYFDGFIWKVRQRTNRENLAMESDREKPAPLPVPARPRSARTTLVRQALYFGVPMLLLTIGAFSAWRAPVTSSIEHMYRAQALGQQGLMREAIAEAQAAQAAMSDELVIARKLTQMDPSAAREAELAFLIYNQSYYANVVLPSASGRRVGSAERASYREAATTAAELLARAVARGTPLAHAGRPQFSAEDAQRTLANWQRIAASIS
ncbi:MAG TPA: hypothetical protein VKB34_18205 [Povalibacter sp.]|nr:hypothetical protein [Povalibacter sp.]